MGRKVRSQILQMSPLFVLRSISKLIWIFLCSNLISACIILIGPLQPSYQEGVEQGKVETFTKQYFFAVSTLTEQPQSSGICCGL